MRLPLPLTSGTKKAVWLNAIRAFLKSLTPLPSASITFRRTPDGTIFEVKPVQAKPGSSGGMHWEGLYDPDRSYTAQAVVAVRGGGPSAGCYVADRDVPAGNPPAYPDLGIYWVALRGPEIIYWT